MERLKKSIVDGGVSLGTVEQAVGKVAEGIDVYLILAVRGGLLYGAPPVGRSLFLRWVVLFLTKRRKVEGGSWVDRGRREVSWSGFFFLQLRVPGCGFSTLLDRNWLDLSGYKYLCSPRSDL